MEKQRTIKKEIEIQGVGLHTGKKANLKFKPSLPNTGINFIRVDLPNSPIIKADISNIIESSRTPRRTSISNNGVEIHTIEHLMAALAGLGIDNLLIEIDTGEVPGLDGSASRFVETLEKAGIEEQSENKKSYYIREPIWCEKDESNLIILPSNKLKISYTLDYNYSFLNPQHLNYTLNGINFEKEIASSRTFCLQDEIDELKSKGLGKGANYLNTVVIGKDGIIDNKLRFEDEFVRHKILDIIGDLYLLGCNLKAQVIAIKSGHSLNIKLLEKINYQRKRILESGVKADGYVSVQPQMDIETIQNILPHRYPFLMVDKILELEEDKYAVGIKNVTINDQFFTGHFPNRPVMPGVMIIEAMAQVAGVLMLSKPENRRKIAYFMSMDKVKFRKSVVPGDQLCIEVNVVKLKSKTGQVHTKAKVVDKLVAEADLMFALVEG